MTDQPVMDSGRELVVNRTRLLRAFSTYHLTVSDPELVAAGNALRAVFDDTTKITSPLLGPALRGERVTDSAGFNALFAH
ncbi:MAG: hypothetical protein JWO18_657, partial [Microbacteriaceae bacterium]|nr:hypothetical protein [Microbacteriaceae bacterium]